MAQTPNDQIIARAKATYGQPNEGSRNPGERNGPYGERYSLVPTPWRQQLAEEGSSFTTLNPTPGTAIVGGVSAALSDTVAMFVIQNIGPALVSGGRNVFPDYLKLKVTVAPASGTAFFYVAKMEPSALRTPTAGNGATQVPNACNGGRNGGADAPVCRVIAFTGGAMLTVPAISSAGYPCSQGVLRGSIPVVNDEIVFDFGPSDPGAMAAAPTTVSRVGAPGPGLAIAPGGSLTIHGWFPSNAITGISLEFEFGHFER